MKKLSLGLALLLVSNQTFACAMCMGDNPNDKYYLWVIGAFILAIYFPMFYMFRTFMKLKNVNNHDLPKNN